jgi:hypothetical protein
VDGRIHISTFLIVINEKFLWLPEFRFVERMTRDHWNIESRRTSGQPARLSMTEMVLEQESGMDLQLWANALLSPVPAGTLARRLQGRWRKKECGSRCHREMAIQGRPPNPNWP